MSGTAHLAFAVLALFALALIVRLVRLQALKAKYSVLWLTVGAALAVAAAVPGVLDWVADQVGVAYQPALFLLLGFGFLLLLAMHFSYELSRLETRVRTLAEQLALLRHELDSEQD
ncbi:MAG: DUF2304 domain-containing protein [Actinobacteria bacterium]|nr:DUF2304 domain-containing protein [Actinomycetota bacterium]